MESIQFSIQVDSKVWNKLWTKCLAVCLKGAPNRWVRMVGIAGIGEEGGQAGMSILASLLV